ncbi:hypothetical protein SDRG_08196 [Saprolegnia diclina VS20]|uniref:Uncharacterized protein n=1 Tax=Saprolegnia diclina (strain VS20) TaxID=1156394 RepID=T0QI68_SAPDV|nr:hypothetical protein SDRG_08196 [Saprolegnia diclina VS20]EQC34426.1 hypothetical protein SDRG_08196 [Saprolegnia diclina VS20]|eukprot:XP_008612288.1 hypothetical protein SDRG_08196 [Saprolegnia diclina VS20]
MPSKRAASSTKTTASKKKKTTPAQGTDLGAEMKFKCFQDLLGDLAPADHDRLLDDCKTCFTCREVEDGENYSLGSTFFVRANDTPTCGMEALALKIFALHTDGLSFDPANSGAEWWTQHIDHRDNIGFHWDRDYGMEEDNEEHVHPLVGTVTYLCVNAGPTVILDKRGTFAYGTSIEGPLTKCIVSRPVAGKHITFDGELLHGAPSSLAFPEVDEDVEGLRVTFLVNIWVDHVPIQSERMDATVAAGLKLTSAAVAPLALRTKNTEQALLQIYGATEPTKFHRWGINSGEEDYIIQVTLPTTLRGAAAGSSVDCLLLKDSCIVEGELSESEDDDEEEDDDGEEDDDE